MKSVAQLYQILDELVCQDTSADDLFASSYIRGFLALSAAEFGDETQSLSKNLADSIEMKILAAKMELTPQDQLIVNQYWLDLKTNFIG